MTRQIRSAGRIALIAAISSSIWAISAIAEPKYGISMYGEPALGADFGNLPYANPNAAQGGRIVFGESGGFDSLNPYILKGSAPWGVRAHVVESLMGRNWDEPFTLYGLLAETIETGPNREWVEFTLREEAAFSDGSPLTIEDVMWSFETMGTKGHPRYSSSWKKIETMERTGPRSVRFTFNVVDLELPLILGLRPVLKKADWDDRNFEDSSVDKLTATGPYTIGDFEPGRFISFKRNPDYWGNDLAFNKGRHNVDEIRYDFFGDGDVVFEAFKAGEISTQREWNAGKWDVNYNFAAVQDGEIIKSEIPHQRPSGIKGFVMNTRRDQFKDWRVRDAMINAFNFEFINQTLNGGTQPRITSYFSNSVLGMEEGPATGRVLEFLEPYKSELLPGALEGYTLPMSDGSDRNRSNLRAATDQLAAAGWSIQDGRLKNADGKNFEFEIMLKSGSSENEAIINIYTDALKRLGIVPTVSLVDSSQYKERTSNYDFDMTYYRRGLSLSPGNEQNLYWGSAGVTEPGTRNYMGMSSPAAEAMIDKLLNAESQDDFRAAAQSLDRVLTSGRYVIPIWHSTISRLAHKSELKFPSTLPMYGDWIGFLPDVWWIEK